VTDRSTDDHQLVVVARRPRGSNTIHRDVNVMEARFARFIIRDSIKHNDCDRLPAAYFIEPATDEERGRVGRGPLDENTKQRLRDARAAKRELRETFHVSLDGSHAEPASGRATAADPARQHEGETTMSDMTKAIANGVRKIKGTKKSKAASKPAAKAKAKAASKPKVAKAPKAEKPKRQWYCVNADGKVIGGPCPVIVDAAKPAGFKGEFARYMGKELYGVKVGDKLYRIVTAESAKREKIDLPAAS
jgi:hypothetical protein